MSTLPDPKNPPAPPPTKEQEPSVHAEAPALREIGADIELPKEVAGAGVRISPASVSIPQPVAQLGVKPVGAPKPVISGSVDSLPLSDEKIAEGLKQGMASSWRWAAELCVRQLRKAHLAIRSVHGKVVRVRE